MRPVLSDTASFVFTDYGSIPWDAANGRPVDYLCEAGRLYARALADHGMTEPDPYVEPPPPVPASISDRQFAHELRVREIITQAEALAYVGQGILPAALASLLAGLPPEQQDDAELLMAGATVFERSHPLTGYIGAAFGWTSEQVDDFFRTAAAR